MKRPKAKPCAGCGQPLVRTQLRPPVYECMQCEPMRPERHCQAWGELFEQFFPNMARALTMPQPYARPRWCFMESNLLANVLRGGYRLDAEECGFYMHQGVGLLAWRATKSIYRLHPALLAELLDTPVSGALPVESLMRMPVWCPYVECDLPVLWGCDAESAKEHRIVGMFAYLDFLPLVDEHTIPTLRLLLDVVDTRNPADFEPGLMMSTNLALVPGLTVDESIARVDAMIADQVGSMAERYGLGVQAEDLQNGDLPETFRDTVRRLISVLLYLCAENAEADNRAAPAPCRVLAGPGGPRLFEPPAVTLVRCGVHVGEQLQRAREAHERTKREAPRGTVAPHVRAAHWHHFWKGPREGARELVLRWLPPIFVKLDEPPEAITVRAVT